MKKILIAGGSGLLGTSLTKIASDKGYKVISTYNSKIRNKKLSKLYKKYNFLNYQDCIKATKNIEYAVLSAVYASGIKNMSLGNLYEQNLKNIILRSNFFEACKINNVKNIIWISSSTVYQPKQKKISEKELDLNKKPYSIYGSIGIGYRYVEQLADHYNNKFKMNIKVIRTTSIYGPYDNFDQEKSHVIPALIKKLYSNKILNVWGDKKVIRDFVYVDDLANAVLAIIKKKISYPINFSSGYGCSIENLAKKLNKISNKNLPIKYEHNKPSSASFRVLNNYKINKEFSIFHKTNLDLGLKKTIDWYLKNHKG